ncbi:TRAP transporter substrate-binding protein [Phormidium tenue]|uniref:ABC transporter substrate-binding protein n=1 Tax=Phormidium tenue NIES-30 TaxID=549789 RepID=A0A1U7JA63_9CYAN|nr:TRAP transporter substrate-binding protein [Phormidium tenue]MBD2230618.1 TRAP transporter substrate-binding protein [Phormidium tenue FACHB-1052]OKH50616.1 ABC transporter substrate-binding protein [Phormidium tenue NIES-30]
MKRRQLVKTTTLGVAAATTASVAACTGASSPVAEGGAEDLPRIDWQMATSWPAALDTILGGAQTFADRVSAMSGGQFTISPRSAGEIAPPLEVLNVVSQGAVPCGHTASYYYVGRSPVMGFGASLPFGFTPQQQNAWLYEGGGLDKLQEFYARQFNVIQFPAGNTGAQMGGWFRREIASVSDLAGLKMRIPGLGGQVMSKLGVTVQTLPGGEIFQALQTGAIDAAEWVGPYDDEKLGLNKVAQYYYYPGWWEPGSTLEVQINLDQWNQLPEVYQQIVRTAAFEANLEMLSRYETRNNEALQRLVDGGVQLREYSAEIMTAAQEATFDLYDEFAASDADFKAIYDDWRGFRDRIYAWSQLNQGAFERFVYSNLKAGGEPPA